MLFLPISFRRGLSGRMEAYRTAYLIAMMSFFVVGWTVHFWGMAYMWFLFMLGSGAWLLDVRLEPENRSLKIATRSPPTLSAPRPIAARSAE
jgi:hypothetical protein